MTTYKYKAYSSKHNKKIHNLIDIAGIVWNHCIALTKRYYRIYGKSVPKSRLQSHIAKVRRSKDFWQLLNSQSVQEICERVIQAYERFFKKLAKRPPTFKKVKEFTSFVFKQCGFKLKENKLKINTLNKQFGFHKSRDYENVKRVTVKRDNLGDIYFCLVLNKEPEKYKRDGDSSIGIDFGLKTFLTFSNGKKKESPRLYREYESKLAELNRNLASKKKGSNNRQKARENLARCYRSMRYKREEFEWKLAHELCNQYAFIALEDLNLDAMRRRWGKKVYDLSYYSFVKKLEHVAKKYDTIVHKVDRYYPSSKTCSACGSKKDELKLSEREYVCESCGHIEDRDVNAAKNILSEGIDSYCTKHKTSPNSLGIAA